MRGERRGRRGRRRNREGGDATRDQTTVEALKGLIFEREQDGRVLYLSRVISSSSLAFFSSPHQVGVCVCVDATVQLGETVAQPNFFQGGGSHQTDQKMVLVAHDYTL